VNLTRFWWGLGVVLVIAALVVCLIPAQELPGSFEINDKVSHLVGHGALALYFAGLVPKRRWWKIFLFLLLFGSGIEFAQYQLQWGREGDARDVIANSAGAAIGLLLGWAGLARWPEVATWLSGRRRAAE